MGTQSVEWGVWVAAAMGGGFLSWVWLQNQYKQALAKALARKEAELMAERSGAQERLRARDEQLDELRKENAAIRQEHSDAQEEVGILRTEAAKLFQKLEDERSRSHHQMEFLSRSRHDLIETFRMLSTEALQKNNQAFFDLARQTLDNVRSQADFEHSSRQQSIEYLLSPIYDALTRVDASVAELERNRSQTLGEFGAHIRSLVESQEALRAQTRLLSTALRPSTGKPRWGDIQLRRVIELAGMVEHVDFQVVGGNGEVAGVKVFLPGGRKVHIDARAPLEAWFQAQESPDEGSRKARLAEQGRQLMAHIQEVAAQQRGPESQGATDFVLIFLPSDSFGAVGAFDEGSLTEWALSQNVLLCTPMTLAAILRSIAVGWKQEKAVHNAETVLAHGRELYDRLRVLAAQMTDLGHNLDKTVESFNRVAGSLEGRVLPGVRRLREQGVFSRHGDEIPEVSPVDSAPRSIMGAVLGDGESP